MIFGKVNLLIEKMKARSFYKSCRDNMKLYGMINSNECCGDIVNSGILRSQCKDCPYLKRSDNNAE